MYRTYTLYVNNQVRRIDDSQELAAEYAQAVGLGPKEALQLSLLIEETVGMLCAMAGDFEGDLWVEGDAAQSSVNLDARVLPDYTAGNTVPAGFMAKIAELLRCAYNFDSIGDVPDTFSAAIPEYLRGGADDEPLRAGRWSLSEYRRSLNEQPAGSEGALDELEQSIVAHIADDVTVGVQGDRVRLTIEKRF